MKQKRILTFAFRICAVTLLAGCLEHRAETDTSAQAGARLFAAKCSHCHGDDGKGAGDASLGLGAPPPNLTSLSQQNDGAFPRNYVLSAIDGYDRREHPTSAMPEFGATDLGLPVRIKEGGVVNSVPSHLLALANYLESIQE